MDIDALIQPIAGDVPAGSNCRHVPAYREMRVLCDFLGEQAKAAELERLLRCEFRGDSKASREGSTVSEEDRAASAAAEKQFAQSQLADVKERLSRQIGPLVVEFLGGEPNSTTAVRALRERGLELIGSEGKDLAVVVRMVMGETVARGAAGLSESLELFEALLDRYGDQVHPQADEDGDTYERTKLATELLSGSVLEAILRDAKIVAAGPGRMIFRDAEALDGVLPREQSGGLTNDEHLLAIVDASVAAEQGIKPEGVTLAQRLQALDEMVAPVSRAAESLRSIGKKLGASLGEARVLLLLERARKRLEAVGAGVAEKIAAAEAAAAAAEAAEAAAALAAANASATAASLSSGGAVGFASSGPIGPLHLSSRDDARRAILNIADFLEKAEPSHPSALFLRRAARLLEAKSFFDIVQDLLPGSPVEEITHLTGIKPPEP